MSQFEKKSNQPDRAAWERAKLDPNAGEWEAYAARGRELLDSKEEAGELLAGLDAAIEERFGAEASVKPKAKIRRFPRRIMALAASLLLLLAVSWLLLRPGEDLLDRHFVHYDLSEQVRTMGEVVDDNTDPLVQEAIEQYQLENYGRSAAAMERLREDGAAPDLLDFYLGLSYLGDHQAVRALPFLRQAADRSGDEPSRYYYALALKATGSGDEANLLLRPLVEQGGLFAERAQALMND